MDACNKQLFFLLISSAMSALVINNVNNNLCLGENCNRARLSSDPITYRSRYRSCTSTQVGVSLQTRRPLTFGTCRPPMCVSPVPYSQRVQGQVLAARSLCASRTVRCRGRTCHPPHPAPFYTLKSSNLNLNVSCSIIHPFYVNECLFWCG